MKPAPFAYHAPESVADVVSLLAELGDEAKPLAGGQSLVPLLALRLTRFEHLVDLNRVAELRSITSDDGAVRIGAMTRQATVERDPQVEESAPLLTRATPFIGHFQIRNRGTIGGSLAHADPAAEYPAVALALDAELDVARSTGTRTVAASEFFASTFITALEPDEILTGVRFPKWTGRAGFAFDEVARRAGDFALAGVACAVELTPTDSVGRAAIAFSGMGATPVRAATAEKSLLGASTADLDLAEIGRLATADLDPPGDVHAGAGYRRRVGAVLVERALGRAIADAAART